MTLNHNNFEKYNLSDLRDSTKTVLDKLSVLIYDGRNK